MKAFSRDILNSRTRIYHKGSEALVVGWVYDAENFDLWIVVEDRLPLEEPLALTVQSDRASLVFNAKAIGIDERENSSRRAPILLPNGVSVVNPSRYCYHLEICSEIRKVVNTQAARKAVQDLYGHLITGGHEVAVAVYDVSVSGAGILTNQSFPPGAKATLVCRIDDMSVELPGEVRHSRRICPVRQVYLSGILFTDLGRITAARWKKQFHVAQTESSRSRSAPLDHDPFEFIPEEIPKLLEPITGELADYAAKLLQRLQRVGQTERRILLKEVRAAAYEGVDALDQAMLDISEKLERLRKYEQELEHSLYQTLDALSKSKSFENKHAA
jgi:hypothetical protein